MLYAVTLTYLKSHDAISEHLSAHKRWLARGFKEEKIILAGPLSNGTGGYILFHVNDVIEVDNFLDDDPFLIFNVAEAEITGLEPALCAMEFPAKWANKARFMSVGPEI